MGGGHSRAFTLLEILVAVAIIALLATIAAMQYQRARVNTFEQLALGNVRLISQSCQMYLATNQRYPVSLSNLGPTGSNPPYIQQDLVGDGVTAVKQGYVFTYAASGGGAGFTLLADPITPGVTGSRHFFIDESMQVRFNLTQPAGASDPVVS